MISKARPPIGIDNPCERSSRFARSTSQPRDANTRVSFCRKRNLVVRQLLIVAYEPHAGKDRETPGFHGRDTRAAFRPKCEADQWPIRAKSTGMRKTPRSTGE